MQRDLGGGTEISRGIQGSAEPVGRRSHGAGAGMGT